MSEFTPPIKNLSNEQTKSPFSQKLFGFYKEDTIGEVIETKILLKTVRNFPANFNFKIGKLKMDDRTIQKTFILEIDYTESEHVHSSQLPLGGWNSHLCDRYAKIATDLAD